MATNVITNRINGTEKVATLKGLLPKKARKPVQKRKSVGSDESLHRWALGTVIGSVGLSAWLNGLSASMHAPTPIQGWIIGVAIPLLVLALGRVATLACARGYRWAGGAVAGAGVGLLILSVAHCAEALCQLTGSGMVSAIPMAVAIDCGLVSCEAVALLTEKHETV